MYLRDIVQLGFIRSRVYETVTINAVQNSIYYRHAQPIGKEIKKIKNAVKFNAAECNTVNTVEFHAIKTVKINTVEIAQNNHAGD